MTCASPECARPVPPRKGGGLPRLYCRNYCRKRVAAIRYAQRNGRVLGPPRGPVRVAA